MHSLLKTENVNCAMGYTRLLGRKTKRLASTSVSLSTMKKGCDVAITIWGIFPDYDWTFKRKARA